MTVKSHWRGHAIAITKNGWFYSDTKQRVRDNPDRKCGYCQKENRPDDIDPCLGELPGVTNACCGHGVKAESYIQFNNGVRISGFKLG